MQNSEIILSNLSKQTIKENCQFERLYRNLFNKDFYYKAYSRIYKNKGSATVGTDGSTADGFGEKTIEEIMNSLSNESYMPKPLRRVDIPKKNGKTRPLGIPSFKDRIVQEICRAILEAIYEPTFFRQSHGFRPNRSCQTALDEMMYDFRGVSWFIEGDIKGFFDNIDHHVLIVILRKKIKDEKFIRLMWKFLRAGYLEDWKYYNTYSGTPQGGIISPILANIYLNEFDKFVIEEIGGEFNRGKAKDRKRNPEIRRYEMRNSRLKKKIEGMDEGMERDALIKEYKENKKHMLSIPYHANCNDEYWSIKYIRYADDFVIGLCGSKDDCINIKTAISYFLEKNLKLELSEEKTLITHSNDKATFLGYDITIRRDNRVTKDKNGVKKRMHNLAVQLLIPEGTIEKIITNKKMVRDINAKKWIPIHRPELMKLSALEIVETYNAELRGIYEYFSMAENVSSKMWQLRYVMEYSCIKTLAGKFRTSVSKIKIKYSHGKHWGIPYETSSGRKICYFYNKGFAIKKPNINYGIDYIAQTYKYSNPTELEQRLRANKCEICGTNDTQKDYEVHHINKVKNLKNKSNWERIMIAKNRKTLIVCKECHIKIHNGNMDINYDKNKVDK
ncbi:TPA: group II intron reverse transcriptase/maturase [Clostridioides difficile]|nr:group II intron reverse transcriptase/maturase [Clostridioides difficile]